MVYATLDPMSHAANAHREIAVFFLSRHFGHLATRESRVFASKCARRFCRCPKTPVAISTVLRDLENLMQPCVTSNDFREIAIHAILPVNGAINVRL